MPKDSGGLMQPLDPEVYAELLKNYKQQLPKEEPKNDRN
jgi:hypothetical protein